MEILSKLLVLFFLIILHLSVYSDIEIIAPPAAYAVSWKAFDDEGQLVTQGTFQPDDLSVSTGYKYATVPNGVDKIVVTSQGYRFDNGPILDFETQASINDPQDDSKYTLRKVEDQIVADLSS